MKKLLIILVILVTLISCSRQKEEISIKKEEPKTETKSEIKQPEKKEEREKKDKTETKTKDDKVEKNKKEQIRKFKYKDEWVYASIKTNSKLNLKIKDNELEYYISDNKNSITYYKIDYKIKGNTLITSEGNLIIKEAYDNIITFKNEIFKSFEDELVFLKVDKNFNPFKKAIISTWKNKEKIDENTVVLKDITFTNDNKINYSLGYERSNKILDFKGNYKIEANKLNIAGVIKIYSEEQVATTKQINEDYIIKSIKRGELILSSNSSKQILDANDRNKNILVFLR